MMFYEGIREVMYGKGLKKCSWSKRLGSYYKNTLLTLFNAWQASNVQNNFSDIKAYYDCKILFQTVCLKAEGMILTEDQMILFQIEWSYMQTIWSSLQA